MFYVSIFIGLFFGLGSFVLTSIFFSFINDYVNHFLFGNLSENLSKYRLNINSKSLMSVPRPATFEKYRFFGIVEWWMLYMFLATFNFGALQVLDTFGMKFNFAEQVGLIVSISFVVYFLDSFIDYPYFIIIHFKLKKDPDVGKFYCDLINKKLTNIEIMKNILYMKDRIRRARLKYGDCVYYENDIYSFIHQSSILGMREETEERGLSLGKYSEFVSELFNQLKEERVLSNETINKLEERNSFYMSKCKDIIYVDSGLNLSNNSLLWCSSDNYGDVYFFDKLKGYFSNTKKA